MGKVHGYFRCQTDKWIVQRKDMEWAECFILSHEWMTLLQTNSELWGKGLKSLHLHRLAEAMYTLNITNTAVNSGQKVGEDTLIQSGKPSGAQRPHTLSALYRFTKSWWVWILQKGKSSCKRKGFMSTSMLTKLVIFTTDLPKKRI